LLAHHPDHAGAFCRQSLEDGCDFEYRFPIISRMYGCQRLTIFKDTQGQVSVGLKIMITGTGYNSTIFCNNCDLSDTFGFCSAKCAWSVVLNSTGYLEKFTACSVAALYKKCNFKAHHLQPFSPFHRVQCLFFDAG